MDVAARRCANAVVLQVHGRLDQETCEPFRDELSAHVDRALGERTALILDFSDVDYVSSAGLRCLMMASRKMKAGAGRILVAAMQPMVAEIFEISHFGRLFEVQPTVRAALAAVSDEALAAFGRA